MTKDFEKEISDEFFEARGDYYKSLARIKEIERLKIKAIADKLNNSHK